MSPRIPPIVVVGGGFAGIAASVESTRLGERVLLLEARRRAGGRASSFTDPESGETIDNGQHILMGCYAATRRLLRELGTEGLIWFQKRLELTSIEPGGRAVRLRCPPLPSPAHLLGGLLAMKGLAWRDRLALFRAAPSLMRTPGGGLTVEGWLDRLGQTENLRTRFWRPIAIAALNEDTRIAGAALLTAVLKEAFGGGPEATGLGLPLAGLSDIYVEPAARYLRDRGGEIRTGCVVERIETEGGRAAALLLRDGERIPCSGVILAVPHTAAGRLLPEEARKEDPRLGRLEGLGLSGIVSVNLWFDRQVGGTDLLGLLESPIQFVFDKSAVWRHASARGTYLACVVSAASELARESNERIAAMAEEEIRRYLPGARRARLSRSMVMRERHATFSGRPEALLLRPPCRTAVPNLFLAGDWTDTGLPGTIEGAVRSGEGAARDLRGVFD